MAKGKASAIESAAQERRELESLARRARSDTAVVADAPRPSRAANP